MNSEEGNCAFGNTSELAEEIIDVCIQWKEEHASKKEPELEWVDMCRIIEIQSSGFKKCVYKEDIVLYDGLTVIPDYVKEERLKEVFKKYIAEHEGKFIAVIEHICRVKQ